MSIGETVGNINTSNMWDSLLSKSEVTSNVVVTERIKIINRRLIKLSKQSRVINVGSGQGYLEHKMKRKISQLDWYCVDISFYGLSLIKQKIDVLHCLMGSIMDIPIKEKVADVVICTEVLEHFDKSISEKIIRSLMSMLKDSGELYVSVPVYEPRSLLNHLVGHNRKYTPEIIKSELVDCGFKIIKEEVVYAKNNWLFKSLLNKLISVRRPNVCVLICQKY